jgi:lipopolysaccharide biosynthesis protein
VHLRDALNLVETRDPEERLVFVKSWNEWGEGNYLEPDQKFGHDYLKIIEEELSHPGARLEEDETESVHFAHSGNDKSPSDRSP